MCIREDDLRIMHPIQNSYGKSMKFGAVVHCTMYNRIIKKKMRGHHANLGDIG